MNYSGATNVETYNQEGSKTNEDLVRVTDGAAWVLDGASGLTDRQLVADAASDGRWYVQTFDDYLQSAIADTERTLAEIVRDGIDEMVDRLEQDMTVPTANTPETADIEQAVTPLDLPAATIAIVRWSGDDLETYSLGDSTAFVRTGDDDHQYYHGDPNQFDRLTVERVAELREEHPDASWQELRERVQPTVESIRRLREMPNGYWALGVNPVAARKGVTGRHDIENVDAAYLFTDGLWGLVPEFGVYDTWTDALDAMDTHGVEHVVARLREAERDDADLEAVPRLKCHDDVGVVRVSFAD